MTWQDEVVTWQEEVVTWQEEVVRWAGGLSRGHEDVVRWAEAAGCWNIAEGGGEEGANRLLEKSVPVTKSFIL